MCLTPRGRARAELSQAGFGSIERLVVPGELEAGFQQAYVNEGIPLAAATINGIADQAKLLGVDASMLLA
jgi:hypothetical protein